jgi:bacterioferritin (cytochrome b1)
MAKQNTLDTLQKRLEASRTTIEIYKSELEKCKQKLKDEGLSQRGLKNRLKKMEDKIEELAQQKRDLLKTASAFLSKIERSLS